MIRDYSRRYSPAVEQRPSGYRRQPLGSGDGGFLWKAVGVFASFAVVIGVAASLWLGWQINSGLGELATAQQLRKDASARNVVLLAQRDKLRSRESVEAAAAGLGLYPPSAGQVWRP
ncbi:MAG: hypothetical protein OEV91_00435 [Desulfobulbaceae bacterium]|nr:hypothetical protein [Desulfobulbaceae bacterium]